MSPRCLADRPCQGLRLPVNIRFVSVRIPGVLSRLEASVSLYHVLAPGPPGLKKEGGGAQPPSSTPLGQGPLPAPLQPGSGISDH